MIPQVGWMILCGLLAGCSWHLRSWSPAQEPVSITGSLPAVRAVRAACHRHGIPTAGSAEHRIHVVALDWSSHPSAQSTAGWFQAVQDTLTVSFRFNDEPMRTLHVHSTLRLSPAQITTYAAQRDKEKALLLAQVAQRMVEQFQRWQHAR